MPGKPKDRAAAALERGKQIVNRNQRSQLEALDPDIFKSNKEENKKKK